MASDYFAFKKGGRQQEALYEFSLYHIKMIFSLTSISITHMLYFFPIKLMLNLMMANGGDGICVFKYYMETLFDFGENHLVILAKYRL